MLWVFAWMAAQLLFFIFLSGYRGKFAIFVWLVILPAPTWYVFFCILKINVPCEENPRMYQNGYCESAASGQGGK